MPLRVVNGATVYLKDVAQVRDGYSVQTSIVRTNGSRGALLTVMRSGKASTLAVVNNVKAALPKILAGLPPALKVRQLFDQSIFVRAAINGVVREGVIAATLTGLMILLFLGSWRSTVIVCISIPLSILTSLILLNLLGQTTNVMTLGGLALAVGILVDDATVEIENTHRNMAMRKPLVRAVLDGAQQIAAPAFVSTLAICIVFVPVLLLTGAAKYLFTPLAMAVVFAMMASYFLSRTLIPTMVHYMLRSEVKLYARGEHEEGGTGVIWKTHYMFNRRFELMRAAYSSLLHWCLDHRLPVLGCFFLFVAGSLCLAPLIGRDFFPTVDSGAMRLHARAPSGTRLEKTEQLFAEVENEIRQVVPPKEIENIIDNIGIPNGGFNLAFGDSPTLGVSDGDILISLKPEEHGSTAEYTDRLRKRLNEKFPDMVFFFEAANITNQILNFGLPAPIDVQVVSRNAATNYEIARQIAAKVTLVPGAADVHIHQVVDYPVIDLNVDRAKAGQVGLTQRDVATSLLISLSSSGQIAPTQFLDWRTGVSYSIAVQTPQYRMNTMDALLRTPVSVPFSGVNSTTQASSAGSATPSNAGVGNGPNQASAAYGNPGAASSGPQLLSNMVSVGRSVAPGDRQPLQCAARDRCLRQCGPQGSRQRRRRSRKDRRRNDAQAAPRHQHRRARSAPHHADFFLPPRPRHAVCRGAGLPADGGEFPELARPLHHPDGPARSAGRYRLDAVHYPNHLQRALPDGFHHVHRRGHRQQHPAGGLRQRSARGRHGCPLGRVSRRTHPHPPRRHDGRRHDHGHAADGARAGRRRRAERAPGPRRNRRPAAGYHHYLIYRSPGL